MYLELQRRNHQGRSFKNQNLSGADFAHSNIQGADFTNANLANADFSHAIAGLTLNWKIAILILAAILAAISGVAAVSAVYSPVKFLIPSPEKPIGIIAALISCLLISAINIILLIIVIRQGIQKTIAIVASVVAVGICLIGILSAIGNDKNHLLNWFRAFRMGNFLYAVSGQTGSSAQAYIIMNMAIAVAGTIATVVALGLAVFLAVVVAGNRIKFLVVTEAMAIATIAAGIITYNRSRYYHQIVPPLPKSIAIASQTTIVSIAVICAAALILTSTYIAKQLLAENEKYTVLRQLAIFITAIGGTSFRGANLTAANFTHAILKSTDFSFANLTRTSWYRSKQLHFARVGETILSNPSVRDLLITGNGDNKSYFAANLRGANLISANLNSANLKTADLTEATLRYANLDWGNLTQIQAIGADFTGASMTGVSLEAWNINSTTILDEIEAKFVYLLEYPKPGTDDRERRPSSGEFGWGEFTSLFQEVLHTVDLIFRNGIDWKAFVSSFKQVQVENEGTELSIQSIENKGDGVVVVKVSVPPDSNKGKIHSQFMQIYAERLESLEAEYQAKLKLKEELIEMQRQHNADMKEIIGILANRSIANAVILDRVVVLNLGNGDLAMGFPAVTAHIWSDGHSLPTTFTAKLPPKPEIPQLYQQWRGKYEHLRNCYQAQGYLPRIKPQSQVTQVSIQDIPKLKQDIENLGKDLQKQLNSWLNSECFLPIINKVRSKLNPADRIRLIIQSDDIQLRRIPWHLWDFCQDYRQSEISLSASAGDRVTKSSPSRNQVRILAILGNSQGLNLEEDRRLLSSLPQSETIFLIEPTRQQFDELLWDERGWDILCFSGHSSSKWDIVNGWIYLNKQEKLSIPDLGNALKAAIERGLHLAIFNSCDGLGLAQHLDDLHVPQIIVMREPVPDLVAQEFLKKFLTAFSSGKSIYVSVREAREKLQSMEDKFPCASWLPVICQNPAEVPRRWGDFLPQIFADVGR